jgi:hypothetical protein
MSIYACVLSYKMANRTNHTVEQLESYGFTPGADLFVFENQAPPGEDVSKYVTEFTGSNLRMTGGFNHMCDKMQSLGQHTAVWLCTNDFDIVRAPPDLPEYFEYLFHEYADVGLVHPSKTPVAGYAYDWMHNQGTNDLRPTWMVDFICPIIQWDDLLRVRAKHGGKHWFDPAFYRGWGIDYETCYLLRRNGAQVVVDDSMLISHAASETYRTGVAPESQQQFYDAALIEMRKRLAEKYGMGWHQEFQRNRF